LAQKHSHLIGFFLILGSFTVHAKLIAEPQRTYQGSDQGSPCFLYVHQEIEDLSARLREGEVPRYTVQVSTSYQHNGQGLGKVTLKFVPNASGKLLEWFNLDTNEFLRVLLKEAESTLENPNAFRIKWFHHDHLHDATCADLKRVE
jgi:hypothetical protein